MGIFSHGIERRTSYITEDGNIEIPYTIKIIPRIFEGNVQFSQKFLTIYMDYNVPYMFGLDFNFLGDKKQVEKIIFNYTKFIVNEQEYDIIISEDERCDITGSWYNENTKSYSFQINNDEYVLPFQKTKQMIIHKSDDIVVEEYRIAVGKLYLDYESIDNISVEYDLTVESRNSENIPVNDTIIFKRIYKERNDR
jgi:hypothetical protein